MTDAMKAQITACRRLIDEGYNGQAMRDLGYAEAAIRAAMGKSLISETPKGETP
mgnify:CR=1 FL=1